MELKIVKFKSAKSVVNKFISLTFGEKLSKGKYGVGTMTYDGKIVDVDKDDFVKAVESAGVWGFSDRSNGIIYVWSTKSAPIEKRLEFFAHEIGHTVGKKFKTVVKEELRADEYASVAKEAYKLAIRYSP